MAFSDVEHGVRKRASRRETFFGMMDGTVPRQILIALAEPWYFPGTRGRSPAGIEAMLRMYFLPIRYNLADGASGLARSVAATAENAADTDKAGELIRKDGDAVYGDNGYQGLEKRP